MKLKTTRIGRNLRLGILATILAALWLPAWSQAQRTQDLQDQQRRAQVERLTQRQSDRDLPRLGEQGRPMPQRELSEFRLDPQAYLWTALDYDNDGQADAYEYIAAYDIQRAGQLSQQRREREGLARGDQQTVDARQARTAQQARPGQDWVRVDIDANNDGQPDRSTFIHVQDLNRARQVSQQRIQREGRAGTQFRPARQGQRGMRQGLPAEDQQPARLTGEVQNLKTMRLIGQEEPHVFAKIQTEQGRVARVDLGPRSSVDQLNLSEGKRITIRGTRARINNRPIIFARQIQSGDQTVQIEQPRTAPLRQVRGEITRIDRIRYRGLDQQHLEAQVRLDTGRTVIIDLGQQNELAQLNLQEGDSISVLVSPIRIDGEQALLARSIRTEQGRTASVNQQEEFTPVGLRGQQQQQQQQQQQESLQRRFQQQQQQRPQQQNPRQQPGRN